MPGEVSGMQKGFSFRYYCEGEVVKPLFTRKTFTPTSRLQ